MSAAPRPAAVRLASFVGGMFTRNIVAKVGAFVLASLVWITVRAQVTETFVVEGAGKIDVVRDFLDEDLMIPGAVPRFTRVEFEGPIAEIEKIRSLEKVEIGLRIRKRDLAGQAEIPMTFGTEKGNLAHAYGNEVRIKSAEPSEITLTVAERTAASVKVERPSVVLREFPEWEATVEELPSEVRVTGPRAEIEKLQKAVSLTPAEVDGAKHLTGRRVERSFRVTVKLELPDDLRDRHISTALQSGEKFECRILFERTEVERQIQVPIVIYYESNGLEDSTSPPLAGKRTIHFAPLEGLLVQGDETFLLTLTFKGPESELAALADQVRREIEAGERGVRAYVRERDLPEGRKFFDAAKVQVEGQLPPGVRPLSPTEQLGVDVVENE